MARIELITRSEKRNPHRLPHPFNVELNGGVKKMGQLYKIDFKTSGKSYVGISTVSAKRRWHYHSSPTNKKLIGKAFKKYGKDDAVLTVLAEHDDYQVLCEMEIEAIKKYNTKIPNGYNLTDGGEGVFGYRFSEAEKQEKADITRNYIANNPEEWEVRKIKMKAAHLTPASKKLKSDNTLDFIINNPDKYIDNQRKASVAKGTIEFRTGASERFKKRIKDDPEAFKIIQDKANVVKATPEARLIMAEKTKAYYQSNPIECEKRLAKANASRRTPEARLKASLKTKEKFSSPGAKERQKCAIAVGWAKKAGRQFSYLPDVS